MCVFEMMNAMAPRLTKKRVELGVKESAYRRRASAKPADARALAIDLTSTDRNVWLGA